MECTVSDMLLRILKKHGVKYICGLPAAQIGLIMDGASRDPELTYVTTRHEEAAGHMAASISRVTDTMGVCFATVGPGATNIVPGVAAAFADNIPMLVIIPAFIISELKTAFQISFILFIPFLIIDMVVASTLMSMGMMMLPPVMISLPFKILLFIMVDGWNLIIRSLINGFN